MGEGVRDEQRKGRKLFLDEINHYMKVAKAIRLTIELQEKVDHIYKRRDSGASGPTNGDLAGDEEDSETWVSFVSA